MKPFFLFICNLDDEKIYYQDLQQSARKYYPIKEEGSTYIYVSNTNNLNSKASLLIADHIIEYNYNWIALYKKYYNYL